MRDCENSFLLVELVSYELAILLESEGMIEVDAEVLDLLNDWYVLYLLVYRSCPPVSSYLEQR